MGFVVADFDHIVEDNPVHKRHLLVMGVQLDPVCPWPAVERRESARAQVEELRAKALEAVHSSLSEWSESLQVADVIFTKFVTE